VGGREEEREVAGENLSEKERADAGERERAME